MVEIEDFGTFGVDNKSRPGFQLSLNGSWIKHGNLLAGVKIRLAISADTCRLRWDHIPSLMT